MALQIRNEIEELVAKALDGDKQAYNSMLNKILLYLKPRFSKTLPPAFVEDALQETLLAIHKSLHTYKPSNKIVPWVNAIAHYKVNDQLRIIYKRSLEGELSESTKLSGKSLSIDNSLMIETFLNKLSLKEKKVVELVKIQELSVEEASQALNLSCSNVKIITHRALNKLRTLSAKEELR